MSLDGVKAYLTRFDLADRVITFQVSSATVELAAQALGVGPERIAKTLSFLLKDGCALVVAAGDARIDNSKFKQFFGEKPVMLPPEQVEEMTGHPVGGVCPFGVAAHARVYLDRSLLRFDVVYPAAGTPQSAVCMTCDELTLASQAVQWVDVCKNWE